MSELKHYGIKGMRKGVRRFQNADGTLNAAGERRYGVGGGASSTSVSEQARKRNEAAKKQWAARVDQHYREKPLKINKDGKSVANKDTFKTGGYESEIPGHSNAKGRKKGQVKNGIAKITAPSGEFASINGKTYETWTYNKDTGTYSRKKARRANTNGPVGSASKQELSNLKTDKEKQDKIKDLADRRNSAARKQNEARKDEKSLKRKALRAKNNLKDSVQKVKDRVQKAKSKIISEEVKNVNLKPSGNEPKTETGKNAKKWFAEAIKKQKKKK